MDLRVQQGQIIRIPAVFFSGDIPTDPSRPRVSIVDPRGNTLVWQAIPVKSRTGFFHYDFTVPLDAPLGAWRAGWTAVLGGYERAVSDLFEVLPAAPARGGNSSSVLGGSGWTVGKPD